MTSGVCRKKGRKCKDLIFYFRFGQVNTEEKERDRDLSFIESIKVIKRDKSKNPNENYSRTNYVPLSTVLTNNPIVKDDSNLQPSYSKPLKSCLENFEFLENKHQIISKLGNKIQKSDQ